jgi:transcriptional regulator with XRE-family HTH domain
LPNKKRDENNMNAQDVVIGLRRYLSESEDDRHEIASKIGVSWITLSAWLTGESEPHKRVLARVAGFLRRFGYL